MNKWLAIAPLVFLAGCSTTMSDRQVEVLHTPTLTLDCATGCSASYTDPRDRPAMPTNGWDVGIRAIDAAARVVTSTAPWAAIGITAAQGIKNAVGDDNSDHSVRDDRVTDNSSRVDNRDNSVRTDSTHEPTVVNQPEPIIVQPPEPVIVQPPAAGE